MTIQSIIDANINRVTKGCRVIEDYVRFELSDEQLEHVIGGMSEARYKVYMIDLINEHRHLNIKS